jgi:2-polyprenyl-6-methoxyphenol hydroxylase-like FAD-dependent oxidoreductase
VERHTERVLIVGAGPGGLALALALKQRGLQPELIERQPTWDIEGAGIHMVANGVRMLRELGVGDQVERRGFPIHSLKFLTNTGEEVLRLNLSELFPGAPPYLGIHRAELLYGLAEALDDIPVRFKTTVTTTENQRDRIVVSFSDGTRDHFDLLVAADGLHSQLRREVFPELEPDYLGVAVWWFTAGRPPQVTESHFMLGPHHPVVIIPIDRNQVYCTVSTRVPTLQPDAEEDRLERVQALLAGFASPASDIAAQLHSPQQLIPRSLYQVRLDTWHTGRILLIGDAAHAMPPTLAQGASMALEDAAVLAELLNERRPVEETLQAFEARRLPRVHAVQEHSVNRLKILFPEDPQDFASRLAMLRKSGRELIPAPWRPLIENTP